MNRKKRIINLLKFFIRKSRNQSEMNRRCFNSISKTLALLSLKVPTIPTVSPRDKIKLFSTIKSLQVLLKIDQTRLKIFFNLQSRNPL